MLFGRFMRVVKPLDRFAILYSYFMCSMLCRISAFSLLSCDFCFHSLINSVSSRTVLSRVVLIHTAMVTLVFSADRGTLVLGRLKCHVKKREHKRAFKLRLCAVFHSCLKRYKRGILHTIDTVAGERKAFMHFDI